MNRFVLHCDLDCFFAAVEERDNPKYRRKPIIIGSDPKKGKGRGVVSTCNYEARKFGLHSALPISKAYELCPQGIYLRPNFVKYKKASEEVMNILRQYSPHFEQVGLDEAYLDVSEECSNVNDVKKICNSIQHEISTNVGITISIGCASSKSIAKIASDTFKPKGICIIKDANLKDFLKDLNITRIPGIGKKSKIYLNKKGIRKVCDIIDFTPSQMIKIFGKHGKWIWKVINGLDKRKVKEFHEQRKSISKERTFLEDTNDFNIILAKFQEINDQIDKIVLKNNITYKTIILKIRLEGYLTYTRSKTLVYPIQNKKKVLETILELYKEFSVLNKKVRLIGIKLTNLRKDPKVKQTSILEYAII